MVPVAEKETMQKEQCRRIICKSLCPLCVWGRNTSSLQQGLHISALIMCLHMAFLLWFHKPVLYFVATSHTFLNPRIWYSFCSDKTTLGIEKTFLMSLWTCRPTPLAITQDSEHKEFTVLLYDVCNNKALCMTYTKKMCLWCTCF